MIFKQIYCPNCNALVPVENINLHSHVAKCTACNVMFQADLSALEQHQDNSSPIPPTMLEQETVNPVPPIRIEETENTISTSDIIPRSQEIFVIPNGVEVLKMANELNIDIKWKNRIGVFEVIFALMWNGCIIGFILVAIWIEAEIMILFTVIHSSIGLGIIYNLIAKLVNTTQIRVNHQQISINHKPVALHMKSKVFETSSIKQLFVQKNFTGNKQSARYDYQVCIKLDTEETVVLLDKLKDMESALYIEQEIEKFLEIEDELVI